MSAFGLFGDKMMFVAVFAASVVTIRAFAKTATQETRAGLG